MNPRRRLVDQEPAGAGRRLVAFGLDLLIAHVAVVVVLQLVLEPLWQAIGLDWLRVGWFFVLYTFLTLSLPILLYFAGYESSARQATPGMQWLGLLVTDGAGERIGLGRALGRNAVKLLPFQIAGLAVGLPANPFFDPLLGQWVWPSADAVHPWLLVGLLLAIVLAGLYLLVLILDGDGRAPHDRLTGTYVLRRDPRHSPRLASGDGPQRADAAAP